MYNEYATKYYGITKVQDEQGWFLMESRGGTDRHFDHEPTAQQIDTYRNELIQSYGL